MEYPIKPSWFAMSSGRLARHLASKEYPAEIIHSIVVQVKATKEARRRKHIKRTVNGHLWTHIINAARAELSGVRTMKHQTHTAKGDDVGQDPKYVALCAYENLLVTLIAKLRRVQKTDDTSPAQLVARLLKEKEIVIPNGGMHWTDYVSAKERQYITELFDAVPDPKRGKRKAPFSRRITPEEHVLARTALHKQITKMQEDLDTLIANTKNETQLASLKAQRMDTDKALWVLEAKKQTAMLPHKWEDLLK